MRDADAACEEKDGAVGGVGRGRAVGAGGESGQCKWRGRSEGASV